MRLRAEKLAAHAVAALPGAWIAWDIAMQTLGPDPVAMLTHRTGDWALRFLLLCLAMTPLRRITGWVGFVRFRRMLGLWAFAYATAHFAVYLVLDLGGYWSHVFGEIAKRPYITVGFAAWVLLVPLAATSTRWAIRRLGRHWARLHRLVYAIGILACTHFLWVVKSGKAIARLEPLVYFAILAVLLALRVPWGRWWGRLRPHRRAAATDASPMPPTATS